MSNQLTVSAALSIAIMSLYVVFGGNSARVPLDVDTPSSLAVSLPALPTPGLLTTGR